MSNFSNQQQALKSSITKGAIIGAGIIGLIIAGLAYWLLGSQGSLIRSGGAVLAGLGIAALVYKKTMASGAAGAKCAKCSTAFSVSRSDRQEILVKSQTKEERKTLDNGDIEITSWLEELYDVDDTYRCSNCSDLSHKTYQTSRKRNEETQVQSLTDKKFGTASKGNRKSKSSSKNNDI